MANLGNPEAIAAGFLLQDVVDIEDEIMNNFVRYGIYTIVPKGFKTIRPESERYFPEGRDYSQNPVHYGSPKVLSAKSIGGERHGRATAAAAAKKKSGGAAAAAASSVAWHT